MSRGLSKVHSGPRCIPRKKWAEASVATLAPRALERCPTAGRECRQSGAQRRVSSSASGCGDVYVPDVRTFSESRAP